MKKILIWEITVVITVRNINNRQREPVLLLDFNVDGYILDQSGLEKGKFN